MEQPHIYDSVNWQLFCANESYRYDIESPFVVAGFMYATDGAILVRRLSDLADTSDRRLPQLPVEKFTDEDGGNWKAWPRFVSLDTVEVTSCRCQDRNRAGIPQDLCPKCFGTGIRPDVGGYSAVVLPGGWKVSLRYWMTLRSMPQCEWIVPAFEEDPIRFRFMHGDGLLMQIAGRQNN